MTEDAAFAALAEALGLAGAVIIVALLAIIVGRGVKRVTDGGSLGAALLMAGLSLILALQAIVSVGGLIGLTPYTGISFPLISRGGTATVVDFLIVACIGSSAVVRATAADQSRLPTRRPERLTPAQFGGAGLATSFSLLLLSLFVLQLGRRSPAPGAFLRSPSTKNDGVLDQWSGPLYYRAAPGPILDRNGQLLATMHADGGGWSSPDPDLEASLGHIVQPLDTAIRDTLGEPGEPS